MCVANVQTLCNIRDKDIWRTLLFLHSAASHRLSVTLFSKSCALPIIAVHSVVDVIDAIPQRD